jgi:hypothetical protein
VSPAGEIASGGVAVSSVQGPGRDALLAPVAEQAGSGWVRLAPDARMAAGRMRDGYGITADLQLTGLAACPDSWMGLGLGWRGRAGLA